MKQHITVEQLNELTDSGKQKLKNWWEPVYGDWFAERWGKNFKKKERLYVDEMGYDLVDPTISTTYIPPRAAPLLSIGQMIEFLDSNRLNVDFEIQNSNHTLEWVIVFDDKNIARENELCDALWEAVKEILNK